MEKYMFHFDQEKVPQTGYTTPLVSAPNSCLKYKSISAYLRADKAICLECWAEEGGVGEKANVYIPAETMTKLVISWLVYRIRLRIGFR